MSRPEPNTNFCRFDKTDWSDFTPLFYYQTCPADVTTNNMYYILRMQFSMYSYAQRGNTDFFYEKIGLIKDCFEYNVFYLFFSPKGI